MRQWFRQLDSILRGDATRMSALQSGRIEASVGGLTIVVVLLGALYGLCMGSYAVVRGADQAVMQLVASAVKLPLLFLLTLVVTFPSLYVFNALVGSRLSIAAVLRLLMAMLGVMLAVLASLGPIVVFFALSTDSYPFMKLLNVAMAAVAGVLGLSFLLRTLHRLVLAQRASDLVGSASAAGSSADEADSKAPPPDKDSEEKQDADEDHSSALDLVGDSTDRKAQQVFKIWVIVFALVGAQMSWVLRPFIGSPDLPFEWFRQRQGNFFLDVIRAIGNLFS